VKTQYLTGNILLLERNVGRHGCHRGQAAEGFGGEKCPAEALVAEQVLDIQILKDVNSKK
jgi:hypothetical protein